MSRESRILVWALRAWALILITLSLAAPLLPEENAWGLWPATYLPAGWRWALALLAAGLALFGDRIPTGWLTARANIPFPVTLSPRHRVTVSPCHPVTLSPHALRLVLALAALIPFYLFRLQHLRWGDAYILIHAIPHPQAQLTYTWQAPLDLFLHAKAWALGHRLFGWPDPTPVYWFISALAGGVFVWVLLGLAGWLGRDRAERAVIGGLVLSLGTMQLFFGYIENYSLMTVGVLIYIFLALRAQRGEVALIWPATALALTHAFHPSTIILSPSLLYLAWMTFSRQFKPSAVPGFEALAGLVGDSRNRLTLAPAHTDRCSAGEPPNRSDARSPSPLRRGIRTILQLAIPYLLVFAGLVALMTAGGHGLDALLGADAPGGGDRNWFVPLFQTSTRWEHYTMFSRGHLLDILNEQLLVAPAIWPGFVLAALFAGRRLPWRDGAFRLLLSMALLYLLLTLTWNPDYGGQRDWDLFAPAALPAALLCGLTLTHALPERPALRAAAWALIAAQAFHTILWIYQNTLPWMPT